MLDVALLGALVGMTAISLAVPLNMYRFVREHAHDVGDAFDAGCAYVYRQCGCPECLILLALCPPNQFSALRLDVDVVDYTRVESAHYPEARLPEGEAQ